MLSSGRFLCSLGGLRGSVGGGLLVWSRYLRCAVHARLGFGEVSVFAPQCSPRLNLGVVMFLGSAVTSRFARWR